ncbi:hypothetical protein CTEN210_09547 [Chaetoceros tenuissimus]|uniref:Uncharacterized protein n=1 Tax=Chaetoceros tenuissimus TaxID=426638 RepID=A0AAD3H7G9_9STRA|nr:hypothetical protein CTEN210_09547 [Chaetoceros tenuissimus]
MKTAASLLLLSNSIVGLNGFQSNILNCPRNIKNHRLQNTRLQMNFFKDMINSAFENDKNLSSEIEGPNDTDMFAVQGEKTEVQKKWIESQMNANKSNVVNDGKGAPMNAELLPGTKWELVLYLTGVPNFDPSNSLYGSKVNISNRDSGLSKDGFAIGADTLPDEPSVTLQITLMEDGVCKVDESAFTTGINGEWKLSDDGRIIRFSLDCTGYQRTVTTKGTIQNVYWSDRQEAERKSSAVYEIPPGQIFAEARVGFGNTPGVFVMGDENNPEGLLKIEKSQGMFGVTTKSFACGKFAAKMITDEE